MSIPSPKERPDLYDFGDVPEDRNLSESYFEQVMPEEFKKQLADRNAKPQTKAAAE